MATNILAFVEQRDGKVKRAGLEVVSEARRIAAKLGGQASAVIIGSGVGTLAESAAAHGASRVFVVDDPRLKFYAPEAYARSIAEAAKKIDAAAVFMAATAMGKDLAPTCAALLNSAAAADCTGILVENGKLLARRPVFAGKAFATVGFKVSPPVLSLRPNVFPAEASVQAAPSEPLTLPFVDADFRSAVKELAAATTSGKVELTEAGTIVTGGRGLKGPENWHLVENLAKVLGAATGASRAVVDLGWRPHSEQVGQTGKTVSPNLYVAIAVSGAIQHQAGMRTSKVIVAINSNPDAPIFKFANYGIVGDAFEVVPALTEELRKLLGH